MINLCLNLRSWVVCGKTFSFLCVRGQKVFSTLLHTAIKIWIVLDPSHRGTFTTLSATLKDFVSFTWLRVTSATAITLSREWDWWSSTCGNHYKANSLSIVFSTSTRRIQFSSSSLAIEPQSTLCRYSGSTGTSWLLYRGRSRLPIYVLALTWCHSQLHEWIHWSTVRSAG